MKTRRLVRSAVMLCAAAGSPVFADQSPAARRQVAPLIRALTDCVARETLGDYDGATAYRLNTFSAFTRKMLTRCPQEVNALVDVYDRVSGEGAGADFLNGPYAADLPRAVLRRIGTELQGQLDARDKAQADEASRLAQEAADEAARQKTAEIERQQRLAEAEAARSRAQADAAIAAAQAETAAAQAAAERRRHVDEEKGAAGLLVAKAAGCARKQLGDLVKSGESAEVLATATMTICSAEINAFVDQSVKELMLEKDLQDDNSGTGATLLSKRIKDEMRDHFVTMAVQAKAGSGNFAPFTE